LIEKIRDIYCIKYITAKILINYVHAIIFICTRKYVLLQIMKTSIVMKTISLPIT